MGVSSCLPTYLKVNIGLYGQSKKEGKDQESIQSSTTPDPGYQSYIIYSKTCKTATKNIDKRKTLITNGSLMKVKSVAECSLEHFAILSTCIKR